jgi:antitoxin PrlF
MPKTAPKKRARLTSKGQITIPLEVRRALGVRTGDNLDFTPVPAGYLIEPVRAASPFAKYRGIGNAGIRGGRKAVIQAVRKMRGQ